MLFPQSLHSKKLRRSSTGNSNCLELHERLLRGEGLDWSCIVSEGKIRIKRARPKLLGVGSKDKLAFRLQYQGFEKVNILTDQCYLILTSKIKFFVPTNGHYDISHNY